jgi:hypothetical protein
VTEPDPDDAEVEGIAHAGADLAGALAGGAVGTIGGPAGVFAGAAVGVFVQRGARAIVGRFHARQRVRAGAALDLIALDARDRRSRGQSARSDGFFDERGELRSDAEELLEAVLSQAANAWEERKVALLARLYSSIVHDASVAAAEARFLVTAAGELTYRQFVILGLFANYPTYVAELIAAEGHAEAGMSTAEEGLLAELDDLWDRRLVGAFLEGAVHSAFAVMGTLKAGRAVPRSNLRLTGLGATLARLTGANNLPDDEFRQIVADLDRPHPSN